MRLVQDLFNFVRNPSTHDGIDQLMANCYRAIGPASKLMIDQKCFQVRTVCECSDNFTFALIGFTLVNDLGIFVRKNIDNIHNSIREALAFLTGIRPTRISQILINQEAKDWSVLLTLLEALPYLGPIESPMHELPLADVIALLRRAINAKNVTIRGKDGDGEVPLPFRANSLRVIYNGALPEVQPCVNQTAVRNVTTNECANVTVTSYETVESTFETDYKSAGPLITGIWIGFVVLGVFIGIIGGTYVSTKLFK